MPTLPPSLSPSKKSSSNNSKRSVSSSNENNYQYREERHIPRTTTQKFNHNGEWLGAGEKPKASRTTSSTSSDNNSTPPPRPKKPSPPDLQYANLDHRKSWKNDPRNQVLPPIVRSSPTQYASIVHDRK